MAIEIRKTCTCDRCGANEIIIMNEHNVRWVRDHEDEIMPFLDGLLEISDGWEWVDDDCLLCEDCVKDYHSKFKYFLRKFCDDPDFWNEDDERA